MKNMEFGSMERLSLMNYSFFPTIRHCFQRHQIVYDATLTRSSPLTCFWGETQLEQIIHTLLTRTIPCSRIPNLPIMAPDNLVKYLAIPSCLINSDKRSYDGFCVWFLRARTVRGRVLIAQTIHLSRLRHYTIHAYISAETIRHCKSMINRLMLGRKDKTDLKHVQLLSKPFLYLRRQNGGLQVLFSMGRPNVQRIDSFSSSHSENWITSSTELLHLSQPPLNHTIRYSAYRHGKIFQWDSTSSS